MLLEDVEAGLVGVKDMGAVGWGGAAATERDGECRHWQDLFLKAVRLLPSLSKISRMLFYSIYVERTLVVGSRVPEDAMSPYGGVSTQQLKERQREELEAQDAGLDSLHDAIVRQKRIAEVIGGEVGVQNEILEDIGDAMDQARAKIAESCVLFTLLFSRSAQLQFNAD